MMLGSKTGGRPLHETMMANFTDANMRPSTSIRYSHEVVLHTTSSNMLEDSDSDSDSGREFSQDFSTRINFVSNRHLLICVKQTWILFLCFMAIVSSKMMTHDDVIKCKRFPRYWPSSLICARTNGWVKNRYADDLRRNCTHHVLRMNNKYILNIHNIAADALAMKICVSEQGHQSFR